MSESTLSTRVNPETDYAKACITNSSKNEVFLQKDESYFCEVVLTAISYLLVVVTFPLSLFITIKIIKEYERAVIFRLGRLLDGGSKGPGVILVLPCIDSYKKVDLRTVSYEAPPQQILSRDAVPVSMKSVVFYRVSNPVAAVCNVSDFNHSTQLMAAAAVQSEVGSKDLAEFLKKGSTDPAKKTVLRQVTGGFGVEVERV